MGVPVFTSGHTFIGTMDVLAPVRRVHTAITTNMEPDIRYTRADAELPGPSRAVTSRTSRPMKQRVSPSATYSMVIIHLLSSVMVPKPATTDLVGAI